MTSSTEKFLIPLSFGVKPTEETPLVVFLFSRSGKLLELSQVRGEVVEFKTAGVNPRLYRVFIVPSQDKKIEAVKTIGDLERFKAYEPVLDIDREGILSR
jgi:hypothetical protein